MIDFSRIKYGVLVAMVAILFGGVMGLSFGCCEDSIKGTLKAGAADALSTVYKGDQAKADKVVKKSWVYMKRAHYTRKQWG